MFVAPPEWIPDPFEWGNFGGALTAQPFGRYLLNTVVIAPIIALFFFLQRHFIEGVTLTGIKN
ncbi:hypothetical protein AB0F88_25960 [Streptosporangium sp. NPDC023963]|uniref:hypothetical protein n=1 Tax=Streptosporangium sp. NPDC023963 TaxID=3155608 RepID=UPI0034228281